MAEKKIICGGFLVGDGLDIDGKTLYVTGGDEEPVEVTFENPRVEFMGELIYDVVGYEAGKPIKFWTGYDWTHIVLNCIKDEENERYYYYFPGTIVLIIYKESDKWLVQQYLDVRTYYYNKNTQKLTLEDYLSEDGSPFEVPTEKQILNTNSTIISIIGASSNYKLTCVPSNQGTYYANVCSDANGSNIKYVYFRKMGSTITYTETPLATT